MFNRRKAGVRDDSPSTRASTEGWRSDRRILYLVPIVALAFAWTANPYIQYLLNMALIYVLLTVGFNIILGNVGQLAFISVALYGLGAYTCGILMYHLGLPFWVALVPSGLMGCALGAITCLPVLRGVRLFYLAMLTLAVGELMRWLYIHAEVLTLGSTGLRVPVPEMFGYALDTEWKKFVAFLVIVTVLIQLTSNLLRSRVGRAFMAVKDNELAAAADGIPAGRYMVLAFSWGGFLIGIAGALYAANVRLVSPEAFNLQQLILQFAMVMVGGVGSLAGAVIGGALLTAVPAFAQAFPPGMNQLLLAVAIILVLLFLPKGLVSIPGRVLPMLRGRYHRR